MTSRAPDGRLPCQVLKKDVVVKKGQIEHTMSERAILCEIRHPYIVRLRFAFQNEQNLYLVTDYYTGGSLFYHLRKVSVPRSCFCSHSSLVLMLDFPRPQSNFFPEARAKFYAAELLLALEHLHKQFIIYRDLKLENVLMDSEGTGRVQTIDGLL